ncbi:hypothetical protein NDU88_003910 [Pleurodeles waltl]|uniref:Uncharacterized protein n=1 Tax=Pleurodeles waltl TaxID=8319 RepID=A0AAV7LGJ8_PLEWA|nr:hypothetical protein NDU88_003910 [Pleurodeles waltl]
MSNGPPPYRKVMSPDPQWTYQHLSLKSRLKSENCHETWLPFPVACFLLWPNQGEHAFSRRTVAAHASQALYRVTFQIIIRIGPF